MKAIGSMRHPRQTPPATSGSNPGRTWLKYGLRVSRLRRSDVDPALMAQPRGARFRRALEEMGGLYATLGRFLGGRTDLLPSGHCSQLLKIAHSCLTPGARALLDRRIGTRVREVTFLSASACSEAYRAVYQGQPVVVEIFPDPPGAFPGDPWEDFCAGMELLDGEIEHAAARRRVLGEFHEWLRLQGDLERKRQILQNLQSTPPGCVTRVPPLLPELASEAILAYRSLDGISLASAGSRRDPAAPANLRTFVEGFVEQALFLSFVCTDFDPENSLLTPDQGVGFRVFPAVASVPAEFHFELLQYAASSIARDSARAIRMLSRMAKNGSEHLLWREFSALQPLLRIRAVAPPSVSALENYWRALAAMEVRVPLFLQLFHREAGIWGQYNGEAAPADDWISETLWPVLGRILRFRLAEMTSLERGREWLVGAGLLFFASTRQVALALGQLRDNDFSLVVEAGERPSREESARRSLAGVLGFAMLLAVFIVALQVGFRSSLPDTRLAATLVAMISGGLLLLLVARIE
ncbi:MAG: hypothetical protein HYX74_02855 [Acidobacteria bacterium]|nr:hypothetical protein [Acidobacteriota bacterium]